MTGDWFPRAMPLAERHAEPHGTDATAPTRNETLGTDPEARLTRWRGQPPFEDPTWWYARLDAAGHDEAFLRDELGAANADLSRRWPSPPWVADFVRTMLGPPPTNRVDVDPSLPFPYLVQPLVATGHARLAAHLTTLAGTGAGVFDPEHLTAQLFPPLPYALTRLAFRTLILELNIARVHNLLEGEDAADRFAYFHRLLADPAHRAALFRTYPVLARQLHVEADSWFAGCERFVAHLLADVDTLAATFAAGGALGTVTEVEPGLGDRHRGGATVTRVRFSGGVELMYKPRPMAPDAHFQDLVGWVNAAGFRYPLRTVGCLDRGDHGWMERVAAEPCADEPARRRFYHRQGGLLALLHLLNANDVHAENLIAAGEHPVLVDLETLVQPGLPLDTSTVTAADAAAGAASRASVMTVGLLPQRMAGAKDGTSVDLSGLGHSPGQLSPMALPAVRDSGSDTMHLELAPVKLGTPAHRPVAGDAPLRLLDYADDILSGFTEAYRLLQAGAPDLAGGPLAAFAGDEVRVLLRATMWYDTILRTASHPDLLHDALDRERHFDALWRDVPAWPALAACVERERADLWRNDIPVFSARTDDGVLLDGDHQPVRGFPLVPGMKRLWDRLSALDDGDLGRQRWLISGALATSAVGGDTSVLFRRPTAAPPTGGPTPAGTGASRRALDVAHDIGEHLARIAYQADDSAQWLGVNSPRGRTWTLGPLRADLYHGLAGVALFLDHLGRLTGDAAHTRLAGRAMATVRNHLDGGPLHRLGGLAGAGGVIYTLTELAALGPDPTLLDLAEELARQAGAEIGRQAECDLTDGLAGTLAGLLALHATRPSGWLRDLVHAAADRICDLAVHAETGLGWTSGRLAEIGRADTPIAGLAHGAAGVVGPLFETASLLGDDRYAAVARAAVAYEQALFDPVAGTWRELRTADPDDPIDGRSYWCYGGVGIALSRLASLDHLDGTRAAARREIDSALATLAGQAAGTHCLCHGDVGNLELYLQAAAALREPHWREAAERHAARVLADIDHSGFICGTPGGVETVGLMTGVSGIGYGLLRLVDPEHTPVVLLLRPSATASAA